ncbi:membrane protein [Halalkalibacter wakoensis JCM 9140]|uniref:Membrane protein n=1 Tax=Halalkalibacter wakoensis JCM 9140 TaxID=1236970 RepID=W4Q6S4_9BACI|nr:carotenoid biosynthesis protein [Halalkalibacter wakoensis]GAE27766.1 membrane protein [Halalkalibacter wakoensis JCM 9140]
MANAVFLILAGTVGGIYFIRQYGPSLGWGINSFVVVFTIFVEWIGVRFGLFFGHYYYNPDFGVSLFGVPITIGFAWLMVIATTHVLAKGITLHLPAVVRWFAFPLVGAFAAVVMDLILDPVAYLVKGYWIWHGEGLYYGIPFSNFIGWFILAFFLHLLIYFLVSNKEVEIDLYWEKQLVILYALMILMFTILAITAGLWLAAFLTVSVAGGLIGLYISCKRRVWR